MKTESGEIIVGGDYVLLMEESVNEMIRDGMSDDEIIDEVYALAEDDYPGGFAFDYDETRKLIQFIREDLTRESLE